MLCACFVVASYVIGGYVEASRVQTQGMLHTVMQLPVDTY